MLENKRICFININFTQFDKLKEFFKPIGSKVVKTVSKNVDLIIYGTQAIGPYSSYRSALYQKDKNKKQMITYDKFLEIAVSEGLDISEIKNIGTIYPISTKEEKLQSFKNAVKNNIWFQEYEDVLHFNDDFYEVEWSNGNYSSICFEHGVVEAFDELFKEENYLDNHINTAKLTSNIYDIIDACGGYQCINKIMAVCIAVKMFVDPSFECKFRVYRDKWEYRGDYPGMCGNIFEIPPAIYWEINDQHPFGWTGYDKYM